MRRKTLLASLFASATHCRTLHQVRAQRVSISSASCPAACSGACFPVLTAPKQSW